MILVLGYPSIKHWQLSANTMVVLSLSLSPSLMCLSVLFITNQCLLHDTFKAEDKLRAFASKKNVYTQLLLSLLSFLMLLSVTL